MSELNGMTMSPNQDPDEYLTEVFSSGMSSSHRRELYSGAHLGIIPEGLSDEYEPILFAAERDPEISLK